MPALLDVSGLRPAFGGVVVLDAVTFAVAAGQAVALTGPNGPGKSGSGRWPSPCSRPSVPSTALVSWTAPR